MTSSLGLTWNSERYSRPRATKASDSGSCHNTLTRSPRAASSRPRARRATIGIFIMGGILSEPRRLRWGSVARQHQELRLRRQPLLRHHDGRHLGVFDIILVADA